MMPIFDLFSKRRSRHARGDKPIMYTYDEFPPSFRTQVIHIWRTAIGPWFVLDRYSSERPISNGYWEEIHNILARELGIHGLARGGDPFERCARFLSEADANGVLDIVELTFRVIDRVIRNESEYARQRSQVTQDPDDAITELNHRFQENAIGYQYSGGELMRVDSQYVHAESVEPAVTLLHSAAFAGPNAEFLAAHEHLRKGRHKEAIADSLKALESTLKAICDARGWRYAPGATAKPLIDLVVQKGLVPSFLESHFAGLRSTLESGLPTLRNRAAGHGQGSAPVEVPMYLATYALHLAAVTIVLLVDAHNSSEKND